MTAAATIAATSAHRMIWVTWQRVGFHLWAGAKDERAYLAQRHRHLFKFRVWIQVWHEDREVEFHTFLDWVQSLYDNGTLELDGKSCEIISSLLHAQIAERYPDREVWIEISEDGECGSFTRYPAREPRA